MRLKLFSTTGMGSTGITAQSLGLGGGLLAFKLSNVSDFNLTGKLGSVANNIGNAGAVYVDSSSSSISSSGDYAHLIVAQSIGAGGGRLVGNTNVAPSTEVTLGATFDVGSPGGYGSGVSVSTYGSLQSSGSHSHGIVAQSIGGGGGLIDLSASEIIFGTASDVSAEGGISANLPSIQADQLQHPEITPLASLRNQLAAVVV